MGREAVLGAPRRSIWLCLPALRWRTFCRRLKRRRRRRRKLRRPRRRWTRDPAQDGRTARAREADRP